MKFNRLRRFARSGISLADGFEPVLPVLSRQGRGIAPHTMSAFLETLPAAVGGIVRMKPGSRRLAVWVLVFAAALGSAPAVHGAANPAGKAPLGSASRESRGGALPEVVSFFQGLVEKALAIVSIAPPHERGRPLLGVQGDNGAGIDPNG